MPKRPSKTDASTDKELARLRELARHLVELQRLQASLTTVSNGNVEIQKENAKLAGETESFNKLNADLVKSNNELEKRNLQLHETLFNLDNTPSQPSIKSPNTSHRAPSAQSQSSTKSRDFPGTDGGGELSEKQKGKLPEKQMEKQENKKLGDEGRWCEV